LKAFKGELQPPKLIFCGICVMLKVGMQAGIDAGTSS